MVAITDSTIRQNVYETLYDTISAISFSVSGVTVTAAYIDDEKSFPQVVIHPVDVDYSGFSFNRYRSFKKIKILIDIWTKKNKDKDVIADEIMDTITSTQISGVQLVSASGSDALETPNKNKIHLKSITLTYTR